MTGSDICFGEIRPVMLHMGEAQAKTSQKKQGELEKNVSLSWKKEARAKKYFVLMNFPIFPQLNRPVKEGEFALFVLGALCYICISGFFIPFPLPQDATKVAIRELREEENIFSLVFGSKLRKAGFFSPGHV